MRQFHPDLTSLDAADSTDFCAILNEIYEVNCEHICVSVIVKALNLRQLCPATQYSNTCIAAWVTVFVLQHHLDILTTAAPPWFLNGILTVVSNCCAQAAAP